MAWYEVAGWILVMLVILGILISLHELGHLLTAKAFNVYCFDYSIGFGPALIHKKRKNGETYFSLRAIPLGGYVSMYGEPGAVPEGMEEPPAERSLNMIHKGKKMVVLSAGIIVNFILGLILIGVSSFACPKYYYAYAGANTGSDETSVVIDYIAPRYSGAALEYISSIRPEGDESIFILPLLNYGVNVPILDSEVYIYDGEGNRVEDFPRVAVYYPSTVIEERDVADFIRLYPAAKGADGNYVAVSDVHKELGIKYYPDVSNADAYLAYDAPAFANCYFDLHPNFMKITSGQRLTNEEFIAQYKAHANVPAGSQFRYQIKDGKAIDPGMRAPVISGFLGWEKGWKDWASQTGKAITAIAQGFAMLFTPGGINNMSSIIGMTAALPSIASSGGLSNIFFFAGLISINLAFFNFLPFPGLDGWQLLTTAVEWISRKRIPAKAQTIASLVGMGLLLALGIFVMVKDVIMLF